MKKDEYGTMGSGSRFNEIQDRRSFLKRAGGGLLILFTVGDTLAEPQERRRGSDYPEDLNAYLRIDEDGLVSCFTGKIEMGQGIITSLAQMLAEELEVQFASVKMVMGDTALCPYDMGTFGSRSTKYFGPPLRRAAAAAKSVLLDIASETLQIPADRLYAENGFIISRDNPGKRLSYGQITKGKKIERVLGREPVNKPLSDHVISGKPLLRSDSLEKVTGKALFTGDMRLPGMLYARVLRPPAHDSKLISADLSTAQTIPGVKVIQDGDFIAVLHEHPETAEKALNLIKASYEIPESDLDNTSIFEHLERSAGDENTVVEKGMIDEGKKLASFSFENTYFNHYIAHAPIETHTALARIEDGEITIWASAQGPFRVRDSVAEALGVSSEKVRVITPFVGGGFGGKNFSLQATEAARLAKLAGRPVQVAWSRKEEFFYDTFRPAAVIKAESGIDSSGRIVYWNFQHLFPGNRSSEPIYDIPHQRVVSRGSPRGVQTHPFGTGAWRGPGSNTNVYAMESQTDIMAQAAGMDPLSFRMLNLSDSRMQRVLKAAAEKFGKSFTNSPSGKGYGIACTNYLNTYVATMAEVRVDKKNGNVRVERVICAQDTGEVINPQGIRIQIESCITMGIGYCLTEEIRFRGGRVLDENFDTYDIPRFSWTPVIETVLIDNPDLAPQGCGEPAVTTMGAVIANAVYDATGARMFVLPMTPERILAETGR